MLKVFFEIFPKFKENLFCKTSLNNTLKVFDNFKNKQKNVWMYNVFRNAKVCILWKFIQYIIHWDKTQMLKKNSSDKINGTKNALFFLSWDPTRRKFTFNWRFLYELKHKVCTSKSMCGIFHFWFCFASIKVYNFALHKVRTLLTLKRQMSFQN